LEPFGVCVRAARLCVAVRAVCARV